KVRVNVYGTNPTRLRGKVWPADQDEPSDWQVQARDQTETMQRSGQVGIGAGLAKATRNGPFAVAVREFVARPVIG
ncbi:MAG TPA: hypothetical protein VK020_09850, partial [Microlunatus sp.]|nr:hypothetical protein [Microlunatus sp.]